MAALPGPLSAEGAAALDSTEAGLNDGDGAAFSKEGTQSPTTSAGDHTGGSRILNVASNIHSAFRPRSPSGECNSGVCVCVVCVCVCMYVLL